MKRLPRYSQRGWVFCTSLCMLVVLLGSLTIFHAAQSLAAGRTSSEAFVGSPEAHRAAARDAIEATHRGKVDSATMETIAAMVDATTVISPVDNTVIPAAFEEASGDIIRYLESTKEDLVSPPGRPTAPALLRVSQATNSTASRVLPGDDRGYAGQQICVACHRQEGSHWAHTIHAKIFTFNPRNDVEARGCEACHGPGAAHAADPSDLSRIISFSNKSKTPIPQQNEQCLTCHRGAQRIFWHGSIHETNRLGCSDCHNPMANFSSRGLTARDSTNQTCFSCHKVQRAQFTRRSHMPLLEGKLSCVDCHNPHGSTTAPLLKADSVNEVCYGCHADKRGPFLFEHAPVRDNCLNCHSPHGSNFEALLTTPRPVMCQQCHANDGHPSQLLTRGNLPLGRRPDPRAIASSCQTCHVNIHGSNSPSGSRFER